MFGKFNTRNHAVGKPINTWFKIDVQTQFSVLECYLVNIQIQTYIYSSIYVSEDIKIKKFSVTQLCVSAGIKIMHSMNVPKAVNCSKKVINFLMLLF